MRFLDRPASTDAGIVDVALKMRNQPLETRLLNSINARGDRVISEGGYHGYM
jgi:hypothetical protein